MGSIELFLGEVGLQFPGLLVVGHSEIGIKVDMDTYGLEHVS